MKMIDDGRDQGVTEGAAFLLACHALSFRMHLFAFFISLAPRLPVTEQEEGISF